MAVVKVTALCNGTEEKTSRKTGAKYVVTNFVDLDGMQPFAVYGDLGLGRDLTPREYEFPQAVLGIFNAEVVNGSGKRGPAKEA